MAVIGEYMRNPASLLITTREMSTAKELVDEQAEDEGLWFNAQSAAEAYLQQALRQLHEAVENGPMMASDKSDFSIIPDDIAFTVCQKEYRDDYDEFVRRVSSLMAWMPRKTTEWMVTHNPMLGGVSPVSMIAHGRGARLDMFITEAEAVAAGTREW
jgi:hypothetical protein